MKTEDDIEVVEITNWGAHMSQNTFVWQWLQIENFCTPPIVEQRMKLYYSELSQRLIHRVFSPPHPEKEKKWSPLGHISEYIRRPWDYCLDISHPLLILQLTFLEDEVKENAQTIYLELENLKSLEVKVSNYV